MKSFRVELELSLNVVVILPPRLKKKSNSSTFSYPGLPYTWYVLLFA